MSNDNTLMGGPLSEADRLAEIQARLVESGEINNEHNNIAWLLSLVGVLEGQLATAQAESVQLNSQLKDPGLDWLIDWAMGTDRDARDHYFHINDGDADSCDCKHEGEGSDV